MSVPSSSRTAVVANISIGLWCSTGTSYSASTRTGDAARALSAWPRAFGGGLMPSRSFGVCAVSRLACRSVACGARSYSIRTSVEANRASSSESATTRATGWALKWTSAS